MAGNIFQKLTQFEGVASGGIATRRIDAFGKFHGITLRCLEADGDTLTWANVKTHIEEIRIELSADAIYTVTPEFFETMRTYYHGSAPTDGCFYIPLKPSWWANRALANVYAWGTEGLPVGSIVVQIRFKTPGTFLLSRIEAVVDLTVADEQLGAYFAIERFPQSFENTGLLEVSAFPTDPTDVVLAYIIHSETAGIKAKIKTVEFKANSVAMRTRIEPVFLDRAQQEVGRTPGGDFVVVDFNHDDNASDYLPLSSIARQALTFDFSTAPNGFDIYRLRLGGTSPQAV